MFCYFDDKTEKNCSSSELEKKNKRQKYLNVQCACVLKCYILGNEQN